MRDTTDIAGTISTVYRASGVVEVGLLAVDVASESTSGERSTHHSTDQDFRGDLRVFHQARVADEVHAETARPIGVVSTPGQLDVASTLEANTVAWLGVAQATAPFVGAAGGELLHIFSSPGFVGGRGQYVG